MPSTAVVSVRVPNDQKAQIEQWAEANRQDLSSFVRALFAQFARDQLDAPPQTEAPAEASR